MQTISECARFSDKLYSSYLVYDCLAANGRLATNDVRCLAWTGGS